MTLIVPAAKSLHGTVLVLDGVRGWPMVPSLALGLGRHCVLEDWTNQTTTSTGLAYTLVMDTKPTHYHDTCPRPRGWWRMRVVD